MFPLKEVDKEVMVVDRAKAFDAEDEYEKRRDA